MYHGFMRGMRVYMLQLRLRAAYICQPMAIKKTLLTGIYTISNSTENASVIYSIVLGTLAVFDHYIAACYIYIYSQGRDPEIIPGYAES